MFNNWFMRQNTETASTSIYFHVSNIEINPLQGSNLTAVTQLVRAWWVSLHTIQNSRWKLRWQKWKLTMKITMKITIKNVKSYNLVLLAVEPSDHLVALALLQHCQRWSDWGRSLFLFLRLSSSPKHPVNLFFLLLK